MNKYFLIPVLILIIFGLGAAFFLLPSLHSSSLSAKGEKVDTRATKPLKSQKINKTFSFPLYDNDGKKVNEIKYTIENAQLQNEIIVKGERAYAIQGRTFLILNIEIENPYDKAVKINARDYVRLIVDNSKDRFAPDIHNDPVEIQAISTKETRLGFPLNSDFSSLTLQVGEITGKKQSLPLNLK